MSCIAWYRKIRSFGNRKSKRTFDACMFCNYLHIMERLRGSQTSRRNCVRRLPTECRTTASTSPRGDKAKKLQLPPPTPHENLQLIHKKRGSKVPCLSHMSFSRSSSGSYACPPINKSIITSSISSRVNSLSNISADLYIAVLGTPD